MNKRATSNRKSLFRVVLKISGILGLMLNSLAYAPLAQAAEPAGTLPAWLTQAGKHVMLAATDTKAQKAKAKAKTKTTRKSKKVRRPSRDFDHLLTGFSLFGAHANVECGDCHRNGILRGTPTRCDQCHGFPGQRASSFKPSNHIDTHQPCDQCHNENIWAGSRFDHSGIAPGTCTRCHNGSKAVTKPGGHIATNLACDACHRTTGWLPASFKHSNVAPGTCATCHGVTATGKPGGHTVTTESCDKCHSLGRWVPALKFDHSAVAPGTCATCHGVTAIGKPGGHKVTAESCDKCHSTVGWIPATAYDHGAVAPGTCNTCHGVTAIGKPGGHIATTESCDACHMSTVTFTGATNGHGATPPAPGTCNSCHLKDYPSGHFVQTTLRSCDQCHSDNPADTWGLVTNTRYSHVSPFFPGRHSSKVKCNDCHKGVEVVTTWEKPLDKAFCGGCHYNRYISNQDHHKKYDTGSNRFYPYDELKDCTTSCHTYNSATDLTIKERHNGKHSVGSGGF